MSRFSDALLESMTADVRTLRVVYADDPVEGERIRQAIVAELMQLSRPASLAERAETER